MGPTPCHPRRIYLIYEAFLSSSSDALSLKTVLVRSIKEDLSNIQGRFDTHPFFEFGMPNKRLNVDFVALESDEIGFFLIRRGSLLSY